MIGRLSGTLVAKHPPGLMIDVGGVGYELEAPMSTFYELPEAGKPVVLFTHYAVKEDAVALYGFHRESERLLFRTLLKISGIGAKTALAILSGASVDEFARLVQVGDVAALVRIPGIGKKTAERLLLELKGRLGADLGAGASAPIGDATGDIVHALLALGYNEREATNAVRALPPATGVADGIRLALKSLAKG